MAFYLAALHFQLSLVLRGCLSSSLEHRDHCCHLNLLAYACSQLTGISHALTNPKAIHESSGLAAT